MFATLLLLAVYGLTAVQAHMQLEYPPPFNASNNPHRTGPADNIYVYPAGCCGREDTKQMCRGYLSLLGTPEGAPVATWAAGSKVTWNITGDPKITLNDLGGTHYGGSCQVGFSTDGGKTFKVAASYEGNCPHRNSELGSGQDFDLTVPEELPSGDVLFAWTWINREQEFTMNCAAVTITNDEDSGSDASSSASPSYALATTLPASSSAAPEPSTASVTQSTTQAASTPTPSGKPVNGGAKQFALEWCSCDCETASTTTDSEDAYEASGCDCKCWKQPQPIDNNKKKRSAHSRHVHRHVASAFDVNKRREQEKKTALRQKRAAAWAARSDLFIPDPIWHDCKLPLTSAELKYPNPGDQVVRGDGEYPLELPATSPCVSDESG